MWVLWDFKHGWKYIDFYPHALKEYFSNVLELCLFLLALLNILKVKDWKGSTQGLGKPRNQVVAVIQAESIQFRFGKNLGEKINKCFWERILDTFFCKLHLIIIIIIILKRAFWDYKKEIGKSNGNLYSIWN